MSDAYRTSTGTLSDRSFLIASGGVPLLPPAMTRSVPNPTIFSTSTPSNRPTTGTLSASGGYFAGSSTLPTTRSPAPIAKRTSVSAGVSDTILSGSPASVTTVPSSSVREIGNDGLGAIDDWAEGAPVAVAAGNSEPVASGGVVGRADAAPPHAVRRIASAATAAAIRGDRAMGEGWAEDTSGSESKVGARGVRHDK